jgi:transcription-repair coupling factor (superfamily II helicase)
MTAVESAPTATAADGVATPSQPLSQLPRRLRDDPALSGVLGRRTANLAVAESARAFTIAGIASLTDRAPIVVAVPTGQEADRLGHDLRAWLSPDVVEVFPAWETLPFERVSPGVETMGRRLKVLARLDSDDPPLVVVAPIRALLQRLGPDAAGFKPIRVARGAHLDPSTFVADLVAMGYHREFQVEHRGEIAVRGGIVDVFPATADAPVRIDMWGDEVDRINHFAVADQRSTGELDSLVIHAARELRPDAAVRERARRLVAIEPWGREHWDKVAEGQLFDGMESWLPWLTDTETVFTDLLPDDAQVLLLDPRRLRDRAADLAAEEFDLAQTLAGTWGAIDADGEPRPFPTLHVQYERLLSNTDAAAWTVISLPDNPSTPVVDTKAWEPVAGDGDRLVVQLQGLINSGSRVVIAADGVGSARRLVETMADAGLTLVFHENPTTAVLDGPGGHVVAIPLESGFVMPSAGVAVLTESDVTGRRRTHRVARQRRGAQAAFEGLTPGDYVVHHHHGVSKYIGMVHRELMGAERDYLVLDFKGSDKLYLPTDQIDLIRPYTGGESPTLSRMGGADFQKQKAKVRAAVQEIAQELVVLYQRRITADGYAFDVDSPWMSEIADSFPYQETPDQLSAIMDVLDDMGSSSPMDRLVCGDVGFGKTEVAMRAAFAAVHAGKQVAVLVPTTLLAQQHHQTFSERFAPYPTRVEVISRFLTPAQQRKIVQGVREGSVDVVIGTHRLLSQDVEFKDLGLLVVDEEQRFGVSHKEAIKQLKTNVDVLTLTATPVPRTLEMSLTGIRDLSLLQTPPAERQPILTYVGEYDERAVAEAIRRELLREGQVFFVHNRVADIDKIALGLSELVPEARIAVAHGQMDEGTLEQVVIDFWEGQYDVLVCTTIIESGIDMPTVNTLVVDRADLLGLGQLHQIRGRVGRSGHRAYAYLFHPVNRVLSETAYERLKTIGEATELGSGFRIAMRDLEIRGAGNLLGTVQTGHIAAVGYDLYCQMVTEAVAELKGEPVAAPMEVTIDLPLQAYLPEDYVGREEQRLEAYRRLASVSELVEVADIEAEWLDRYGPVPEVAKTLLHLALVRAECHRTGLSEISMLHRGTLRLASMDLSQGEQLRLRRLGSEGVFVSGLYKEDAEEVHLKLREIDATLPGRLFGFLQELRLPS